MGAAAAALLGLVQGLTEFFPVSSSGHLVLVQALLGVRPEGILLEVMLHVGTAGVVVAYYRRKVAELLRPRLDRETNRYRLAILVGLVPAGVVGILFEEPIERLFESAGSTLLALATTGLFLLATRFAPERDRGITLSIAFLIGVAQAVAILPGISRSGATITAALFLGVRRKDAAEFSFLVSVPAILGAALLTARDLGGAGGEASFLLPALLGTLVAVVSGTLALRYLVRAVLGGWFHRFGWYCLALAAIGAVVLRAL
ncbi:MAG: undecaprenyl-diphosphate phosphatase [Candidatus Eisenbacteria bacterium]